MRKARALNRIMAIAIIVIAYCLITEAGMANTLLTPSARELLQAYRGWVRDGSFYADVSSTIVRVLVGYLIGSTLGLAAAIAVSFTGPLSVLAVSLVDFFRVISPLAWMPFAILLFGLGNPPAIFLVALASFFPVFVSALSSIRSVSRNHIEVASMFGVTRQHLLRYVYLPATGHSIFVGLRVAFGIAWYVVVAAEMLGAQSGLGYSIQANKLSLRTAEIVVTMFTIGVLGVVFTSLFDVAEALFFPYSTKERTNA